MKKLLYRFALGLLLTLIIVSAGLFFWVQEEYRKLESDDPLVWQTVIDAFKSAEKEDPVPDDAVLFVGSSSIRFWSKLAEDMAPLPVIQRGFGGAKIRDIIYYADQIIIPYHPKAIVLFAGTNDISGRDNDKRPKQVLRDFQELVGVIEAELAGTPLYFLSITPTEKRWEVWPQLSEVNRLIQAYAENKEDIHFVDCTPFLLTQDRKLRSELLWYDGVHLNREGYKIWADILKKELLKDIYPQFSRIDP